MEVEAVGSEIRACCGDPVGVVGVGHGLGGHQGIGVAAGVGCGVCARREDHGVTGAAVVELEAFEGVAYKSPHRVDVGGRGECGSGDGKAEVALAGGVCEVFFVGRDGEVIPVCVFKVVAHFEGEFVSEGYFDGLFGGFNGAFGDGYGVELRGSFGFPCNFGEGVAGEGGNLLSGDYAAVVHEVVGEFDVLGQRSFLNEVSFDEYVAVNHACGEGEAVVGVEQAVVIFGVAILGVVVESGLAVEVEAVAHTDLRVGESGSGEHLDGVFPAVVNLGVVEEVAVSVGHVAVKLVGRD